MELQDRPCVLAEMETRFCFLAETETRFCFLGLITMAADGVHRGGDGMGG